MTAHVTSVGPNQPVVGGTVEFFDRTASQDGIGFISTSLGTAPVESTGAATLATTSLSADLHYLQACFSDTTNSTEGDHASCSDGLYEQGVSAPAQCAPAPSFTAQPADATTTYGQSAYFSATMSSLPDYVQWQVSSDGGSTWTNAPGDNLVERDTPAPGSYFAFDSFYPSVAQSGENVRVVASACGGSTTSNTATLTVNRAAALIVANDKTMGAGDAIPRLDATYGGVVIDNGATPSGMSGVLGCTTTASPSSPVGTYPITCSGLSSPNLTITYLPGTLTVAAGTQTITFSLGTLPAKTYGDAPFDVSSYVSATSRLPVSLSSATPSVCTVAGSTVTIVGAGTCTINADQAGNSDYGAATQVQQSFTVNKKAITVVASATPASQPYGTATAPAVNCTSSGFVGTDTFATPPTGRVGLIDPTGVFRSKTIGSTTAVGTYIVRCSGGDPGSSYSISGYTDGTFTITSAPTTTPLTITANNKSYTYGTDPATLDVRYSTSNPSLTGTLSCNAYATSDTGHTSPITLSRTTPVGDYAIHCSGLSGSSYTITWADGTLTVNSAPLSVSCDNQQKYYGDANPSPLSGTITGVVGSDGISYSCTTAATTTTGAGTAPIAAGVADPNGKIGNYTLTPTDGTLTIDPRPITVTADAGQSKMYGQNDPSFTSSITSGSLVNSESLSGALARASGEHVGSYAITKGTLTAGSNYDLTFVGANFGITPAPLTITADNQQMTYGGTVPSFTWTPSGLTNSDTISSITGTTCGAKDGSNTPVSSSTPAGSYDITCSGASDDDYTISYTKGTLTVNSAATSLTIGSSANPSVAGTSVIFTSTVSPVPDGGKVTFSDNGQSVCSNVPVNTATGKATCQLSYSKTGSHSITASYTGSGGFLSSTASPALTQYVDTDISKYLSNGVYKLDKVTLSGAYLPYASLAGASMVSTNLSNSTLIYATIINANLTGANLSNSNASYADLSGSNLTSANVSNTNLTGAKLVGDNLTSANVSNATLTGADLTNANLTGANLKGAKGMGSATVTSVTWSHTTCPDGTNSSKNVGGTCLGHL